MIPCDVLQLCQKQWTVQQVGGGGVVGKPNWCSTTAYIYMTDVA